MSCHPAEAHSRQAWQLALSSPAPNRVGLVLGWAEEEREQWSITRVQIDDQLRPEWDAESQRPVMLELAPGIHSIQLESERRESQDGRQTIRRFRSAPISIDLSLASIQLCAISISSRHHRPNVHCEERPLTSPQPATAESLEGPRSRELIDSPYRAFRSSGLSALVTPNLEEEPPNAADAPPTSAMVAHRRASDLIVSPYAEEHPGDSEEMLERVHRLEQRIERLEALLSRIGRQDSDAPSVPSFRRRELMEVPEELDVHQR